MESSVRSTVETAIDSMEGGMILYRTVGTVIVEAVEWFSGWIEEL